MKTLHKDIVIPALKGKETIARADDVFTGWIDSDFESWNLDKKGQKTEEMKVVVNEMTEDATFIQLFTKPEEMDLSQEQIIWFCKNHQDLLREDGYGTFFLFKVDDNFFVASVRWVGRELGVSVSRLSGGSVWVAEFRYRFVLPQLAETENLENETLEHSDSLTLEQMIEKVKEAGYTVVKII